jgi:hypothetical protein
MTNEMQKNLTIQNTLLETSKIERSNFVQQVIEALENGEANPLHVHLQVKCTEELIKGILSNDRYKELTVSEAEKHGKSFEFHNAGVQIKETGVKYDFTVCNDEIWNELNSQIEALEKVKKDREEFLKTISGSLEVITKHGEVVNIYPPAKSSTTSIAVTLK